MASPLVVPRPRHCRRSGHGRGVAAGVRSRFSTTPFVEIENRDLTPCVRLRFTGRACALLALRITSRPMQEYLAEAVGTMLLVLLGDGVVANVLLARSKGQGSGWIVITTGWGVAVAMAVYAVGRRQRRTPQPRGDDWSGRDRQLCVGQGRRLHRGPDDRCVHRRGARLDRLSAPLERDRGSCGQAGCVLHGAGHRARRPPTS